MAKTAIIGVNLGGWLVLEPWISPSLFAGTDAPDEYTYCDTADAKRFRALSAFRKRWITREDFRWLAAQKVQAVRIPVGYWIFGDVQPYVGGIEYLDRAFGWAEAYGLKVLVCLHGAPGTQNGEMHSGRQGDAGWHRDPANITLSVQAVGRLAERYHHHKALLGIELLNEPSRDIPKQVLKAYYKRAYRQVRRICGPRAWVVFSDCFQPERWSWDLHWPLHRQAYLDNHQYQCFSDDDKKLDLDGHLRKTTGQVTATLRRIATHRRLVVGEWSLALDEQSLAGVADRNEAYAAYAQAQLAAYGQADAWFFWTYRTESGGPWSFRDMVAQGLLDIRCKHDVM